MTKTHLLSFRLPDPLRRSPVLAAPLVAVLLLASCSSTSSGSNESQPATTTSAAVDTTLFLDGALAADPITEDCTLSGGATTTCYRLTVSGYPTDHEVGPFCPETITDGADKGGIWFDGSNEYDISGEFIKNLATTYGDSNWKMYDENGDVIVTDTKEEFDGAARPDVDPALQNHCVEGKVAWLENGEPVESTVHIPTTPVAAGTTSESRAVLGVTLDGVRIDASAPDEAILAAYTIAAFDDCGGHFNPIEGYHLHGAVGCSEVGTAPAGDTAQFGYALDGYQVRSPYATTEEEEAAGLDSCNGHTTDELPYHYHANQAKDNLVIQCFTGQTAESEDAAGDGGPPGGGATGGGPPGGGPPAEAARLEGEA